MCLTTAALACWAKGWKLRADKVQTVVTWGWIPFIIVVGYRNSSPQPSLIK